MHLSIHLSIYHLSIYLWIFTTHHLSCQRAESDSWCCRNKTLTSAWMDFWIWALRGPVANHHKRDRRNKYPKDRGGASWWRWTTTTATTTTTTTTTRTTTTTTTTTILKITFTHGFWWIPKHGFSPKIGVFDRIPSPLPWQWYIDYSRGWKPKVPCRGGSPVSGWPRGKAFKEHVLVDVCENPSLFCRRIVEWNWHNFEHSVNVWLRIRKLEIVVLNSRDSFVWLNGNQDVMGSKQNKAFSSMMLTIELDYLKRRLFFTKIKRYMCLPPICFGYNWLWFVEGYLRYVYNIYIIIYI